MTATDLAPSPTAVDPLWRRAGRRVLPYAATAALTTLVTVLVTRMWRATWSVPFQWVEDTISSAGHFKTTLETGWYEYQPRLGWPYGQRYHDFPFSDDLMQVVIKGLGVFSSDWVWVFNTFYLLSFPAAAVTALFFLRRCHVAGPLAIVLSVLYAIAPYHFFRGERHFFLSQYWMVPLALWVVLGVVQGKAIWAGRELPDLWRQPWRRVASALSGRGAGTAAVLVLTTLSGAYYGVFAAVLIAGCGALGWLRRRNWKRLGGAVVAVAVVGATLWLALLPDRLYLAEYGPNTNAAFRDANGAEMYALTLAQLLMPNPEHSVPVLAEFRAYFDASMPYGAEKSSLGLVAAIGLILGLCILTGVLFGRMVPQTGDPLRDQRRLLAGQLSVILVLGLVVASVGGIGSAVAIFASDAIRGWNRMSIFLALPALALVGLGVRSLLERFRRRTTFGDLRTWTVGAAVLVLIVGVADQGTDLAIPDYENVRTTFLAERDFVAAVEAQLPPGSAVFQYPVLQWPEGPVANYMHSNDQLRLYLHSTTLNFSGGGIKGRPQVDWTTTVAAQEPAQMLDDVAVIGFSGLIVDRWGLADLGTGFEATITPILGPPAVVSSDGRWSYFPLTAEIARIELTMTPQERAEQAARLTNGASLLPS